MITWLVYSQNMTAQKHNIAPDSLSPFGQIEGSVPDGPADPLHIWEEAYSKFPDDPALAKQFALTSFKAACQRIKEETEPKKPEHYTGRLVPQVINGRRVVAERDISEYTNSVNNKQAESSKPDDQTLASV